MRASVQRNTFRILWPFVVVHSAMFTYVFRVFHCRASNQQNRNDWRCEWFELIFMAKYPAWTRLEVHLFGSFAASARFRSQRWWDIEYASLQFHLIVQAQLTKAADSYGRFTRPGNANGISNQMHRIEIAKCVKRKVNFCLRRNWCIQRFRLQLQTVWKRRTLKNFRHYLKIADAEWRATCRRERRIDRNAQCLFVCAVHNERFFTD